MENINYGLLGSTGKLGREVQNVFVENQFRLVYELSLEGEMQKDIPQILIDCSLPENFENTIALAKKFNCPLIIATTGLTSAQMEALKTLAETVPVVQSYNYSLGIQILLKLTKEVQKYVDDWDIEISETHHRFKKDKPSGTAIMIRNAVEKEEVNISSLRLGNVFGEHTISFGGLGEVLSISHSASSRRTFAEGIFRSAIFLLKKKNGIYSFTDVINDK
ncbi:MAG: 4-hydroxy-tetrahydrodipicolinate reductase [Ignavibacteriaceae bacterium]|nr:4-hydroxy-tetrahydrodipicolinate reductase [Ignavibacteriaceae bacterium]